MHYLFIVRRRDYSHLRDLRTYDDEPPPEKAVLEITVGRERFKVRVLSIHWPDRTGITPAEVTVEEIA